MKQYLDLLEDVLLNGKYREDRTGTGTYSVFGKQICFNLQDGFPLLTTKKLHTKSIIYELLWFLKGDTNTKYLNDNGVHIWDEWADKNGDLGPIYGKQWRKWIRSTEWERDGNSYTVSSPEEIDQIKTLIENLKNDPFSRRHIISAWNVGDLDKMALMPCHVMFQFYVEQMTDQERANYAYNNGFIQAPYICLSVWKNRMLNQTKGDITGKYFDELKVPKYKLSCQLYQRSGDLFLGVPFNISSYALLTHMIAQVCGYAVGDFVHTFGDLHLYSNHTEQAKLLLTRKNDLYKLPTLWLNPDVIDIDNFKFDDINIIGYQSHPSIKGDIAV